MTDLRREARWNEDDPELPGELCELLRAGRAELGTAPEVAELARRLGVTLGPSAGLSSPETALDAGQAAHAGRASAPAAPPAAGAAPQAATSGGLWALGGVGAAIAIGVAAFVLARDASVPERAAPPVEPTPPTAASAASAPVEREAMASVPAASLPAMPPTDPAGSAVAGERAPNGAAPTPPRAKARAIAPRTSRDDGVVETRLLEQARAALPARPAQALELTRRHQARFPHGVLAEEREVIAIEALQRLGRKDAASARAAAFERRYRGSVHQPRLLRGTDTSAPPGAASSTLPQ